MERISSRQNAIVKRFRDMARAPRGQRAADAAEVLLDGEHLLQEALASDVIVEVAAFSDRQLADEHSAFTRLASDVKRRGGRVLAVGEQVLSAMSPVQHPSGVVAIGRARPSDVRGVMAAVSAVPLVLVLAGLQDPGNMGAIIRTAAAFGAAGVIATEGSANPFGWKALRGAMGATFRIPIAWGATLADVITSAREQNARIIAAVPRGGTALTALDLRPRTTILLGGEGAGLPVSALTAVDATLTIPMRAPVESLNVSVAAAVVLYEAARQQQA